MPTPGRLRKPRADLWAAAREGKKVVVAAVEVTWAGLRVKYSQCSRPFRVYVSACSM